MIKRVIWILWANDMNEAEKDNANLVSDTELGRLKDEGWQETSAISKAITFKGHNDVIAHRDLIVYTLYKRTKK